MPVILDFYYLRNVYPFELTRGLNHMLVACMSASHDSLSLVGFHYEVSFPDYIISTKKDLRGSNQQTRTPLHQCFQIYFD